VTAERISGEFRKFIGGEGLSSKSMKQRLDSSSPQRSGSLPLNYLVIGLPLAWFYSAQKDAGERAGK